MDGDCLIPAKWRALNIVTADQWYAFIVHRGDKDPNFASIYTKDLQNEADVDPGVFGYWDVPEELRQDDLNRSVGV